jgi:hypothetical protein
MPTSLRSDRLALATPLVSPRYLPLRRDSKRTLALSLAARTNPYYGYTLRLSVDLNASLSFYKARASSLLAFPVYIPLRYTSSSCVS